MKNGTLKRVFGYIGRYRYLLPVSLLFALVTVAVTLLVPFLIGEAIDCIVGVGKVEIDKIVNILISCIGLILIGALAQWLMSTINNRITYQVAKDVRADAFSKIEKLPLSYVDTTPHGDTLNRIVNDTEQFSEGLLLGFTQLFTGALTILGTLVMLIVINYRIAIVVFVLTPLSLFVARFIASRTHSMFMLQSKTKGESTSFINETLQGQKTVKAFSHEDESIAAFSEINDRLEKYSLRAIFFSSLTNPSTRFVNSMVYAAVALVGALTVISSAQGADSFKVGELVCLLSYANQYTKPFNEISGVVAEFQNALACASRVFSLIDEKEEIPDKEGALSPESVEGNVKLDNVKFSYTDEKPLITGLTLDAKKGTRVAIVGPTGCGKTTLINLLMRFYDVKDGSISLDGVDVRDMQRRSLRKSYGMVLQDTWLGVGTVKDIIKTGKQDASDDEVIEAARAAHAHSFIKRLAQGYDTYIGEDGGGLSQGQKQLLCIARVMLSLPPMVILDEATSSIDTRTEIKINDAFKKMMQGRTSFVVAHRLSTIRESDVIIVMRDGDIVEKGTHEELMALDGFYHELYMSAYK